MSQSPKLQALQQSITIHIVDQQLLLNAFVHRSYLNEHRTFPLPSNEKLEFLGDSVLSLITSVYLFRNYPQLHEGDYTEIKASIVKTSSLADAARALDLGSCLLLSKGEERGGGRDNTNLLADCFEALIAAIFLDRGFDAAFDFVCMHLFGTKLDEVIQNNAYHSNKSQLQEFVQATRKVTPIYKTLKEDGPEHNRVFTIQVSVAGRAVGMGVGRSKKEAEELAAEQALSALGDSK
jgi:ribonuclease-3